MCDHKRLRVENEHFSISHRVGYKNKLIIIETRVWTERCLSCGNNRLKTSVENSPFKTNFSAVPSKWKEWRARGVAMEEDVLMVE